MMLLKRLSNRFALTAFVSSHAAASYADQLNCTFDSSIKEVVGYYENGVATSSSKPLAKVYLKEVSAQDIDTCKHFAGGIKWIAFDEKLELKKDQLIKVSFTGSTSIGDNGGLDRSEVWKFVVEE